MHARHGENAANRGGFRGRAAESGLDGGQRQGAVAGTFAQARRAGSGDFARSRQFHGAPAHLSQSVDAPAASPQTTAARAVFDAVEQARVEAIGSRRMQGVAGNLVPCWMTGFNAPAMRRNYSASDAPIEDAVAMIVRERLTGLRPPANAEKIVELWRPLIEEERAGISRLDRLSLIEDQRAFAMPSTICSSARNGRGPQHRKMRRTPRKPRAAER